MHNIERNPELNETSVFKVDLNGITSYKTVVVRISEILKIDTPRPTEQSLIKGISKLQNCLIYFAKSKYFESKQGQDKMLNLFK